MAIGGGSGVAGYEYSAGIHFIAGHGPADKLVAIYVDDKEAWNADDAANNPPEPPAPPGFVATVAGMWAEPAGGEGTHSTVTYPGDLITGVPGKSYRLELASGGSVVATITDVFTPDGAFVRWHCSELSLSFSAQTVTIIDVAEEEAAEEAEGEGSAAPEYRIRIDKPDLFGGVDREGGVVGDIDVLRGEQTQGRNDYLAGILGEDVPAFRGLISFVLRQVRLGLSPYLKAWKFRVQRIYRRERSRDQWFPETAGIPAPGAEPEAEDDGVRETIYWHCPATQPGFSSPAALRLEVDPTDKIRISKPSMAEDSSMTADAFSMFSADDEPSNGRIWTNQFWVSKPDGSTIYSLHFGYAVPTEAGALERAQFILPKVLTGHDVYIFHIGEDGDASGNRGAASIKIEVLGEEARSDILDMNIVHCMREVVSERKGMNIPESMIGDSWEDAAQVTYAERLGISLHKREEIDAEDLLNELREYADATVYVDRRTGKWEIKLIRDDYDPDTLPVIGHAEVESTSGLERRDPAEGKNSLIVEYYDRATRGTGTLQLHALDLQQEVGAIRTETLKIPGVTHEELAGRLGDRHLRAGSAPIRSGSLTCNRAAADLNPGDPFKLNLPRDNINNEICRVVRIEEGGGTDGRIRLDFASDVFSLSGPGLAVVSSGEAYDNTGAPAAPVTLRLVEEATYWHVVNTEGEAETDALLADDPDAGGVAVAVARDSREWYTAQVWTDTGSGYARDGSAGFVPGATLATALTASPTQTVVPISGALELDKVAAGSLASIGREIVRVDEVAANAITVGRGALDTVPIAHDAGEAVLFWGALPGSNATPLVAGIDVGVKIAPVAPDGALALSSAPEDVVALDSRAIRPLPVGNLKANGEYEIDTGAANDGDIVLTWAHRSRIDQTGANHLDYTSDDVGPEPGVAYVVEIYYLDPETGEPAETPATSRNVGTAKTDTITESDFPEPEDGEIAAEIRVRATRDGYSDWTYRAFRVLIPTAPSGWDYGWGQHWGA